MHKSSAASEIAIGLGLFLDQESPLFYQWCNTCQVKNSKRIGHHVITAQVQSWMKVHSIVADVSEYPFPVKIFLVFSAMWGSVSLYKCNNSVNNSHSSATSLYTV